MLRGTTSGNWKGTAACSARQGEWEPGLLHLQSSWIWLMPPHSLGHPKPKPGVFTNTLLSRSFPHAHQLSSSIHPLLHSSSPQVSPPQSYYLCSRVWCLHCPSTSWTYHLYALAHAVENSLSKCSYHFPFFHLANTSAPYGGIHCFLHKGTWVRVIYYPRCLLFF